MAALVVATACDDDPTRPVVNFDLAGCPTGRIGVNSPIALQFTAPVTASTVTAANIVVTNARTGNEIPGSLSIIGAASPTVTFTPSSAFPFGDTLRIRVQNLLSSPDNQPIAVRVCEVPVQLPPITQLFWRELPSPSGTRLVGASLYGPDSGWVASAAIPLFRREGGDWLIRFSQPQYSASFDVDFVTRRDGFGAHFDSRNLRAVITASTDSGRTFDTIYVKPGAEAVTRLHMRRLANDSTWGVAVGGSTSTAIFLKYLPGSKTFALRQSFSGVVNAVDISFPAADTTNGAVVVAGSRPLNIISQPRRGRVYVTSDGGNSWSEVAGSLADTLTVTYRGVARLSNGTIFVAGGNGFLGRLTPVAGGYTMTRIILPGIQSQNELDFTALIFNDVEFAPGSTTKGWVVGAQLVGFVGGVPQFRGLIFETTDGGQTWTRQGVSGAPDFGAEFPPLNRIEALSATNVWLVGDAGVVLEYRP